MIYPSIFYVSKFPSHLIVLPFTYTSCTSCHASPNSFLFTEGYERLAAARRQGASTDLGAKKPDIIMNNGKASSVFDSGPSNKISASAGIGSDFDMFAEDDEKATVNPVSDVNAVNPNGSGQPSESKLSNCTFFVLFTTWLNYLNSRF